MYYSDEIVDEIREKSDIVEVISSFIQLKKSGANYMGLCPFHGEKTPSFSVNRDKQIYHCFGCGVGGNVFTFLMEYENMTFPEALKELAEKSGVTLPETTTAEERKKSDLKSKMLEIYKEAATFYYFNLRNREGLNAVKYLKNRGLSDKTINSFGLGYSLKSSNSLYNYLKSKGYGDELMIKAKLVSFKEGRGVSDMFWNRIIFPIMNRNDKVIAFGGRVMGNGMPKYLNSSESPIFNKRENLYGLNIAKRSRENFILLCEGYMDVIAMHQAGFTNAVASLGTALTEEQARIIARYVKEVIITYDSDGAGTKASLRAIPILKEAGLKTRILNLSPFKDPDEFIQNLGKEEFLKRIKKSENSFDFELKNMEKSYNLSEPDGKTDFLNKVAYKLTEFNEEIERENYITAVAEKYFIPRDILRKQVNKLGASREERKAIIKSEKIKSADKIKKGNEGKLKANRLLISYIAENSELYYKIKNTITVDDFLTPLYKDVAGRLFLQIDNKSPLSISNIISRYETSEEQSEVTAIFEEKFAVGMVDKKESEKAFEELVIKVKETGIEEALKKALETGDTELVSKIIKEKENLKNIKIQ